MKKSILLLSALLMASTVAMAMEQNPLVAHIKTNPYALAAYMQFRTQQAKKGPVIAADDDALDGVDAKRTDVSRKERDAKRKMDSDSDSDDDSQKNRNSGAVFTVDGRPLTRAIRKAGKSTTETTDKLLKKIEDSLDKGHQKLTQDVTVLNDKFTQTMQAAELKAKAANAALNEKLDKVNGIIKSSGSSFVKGTICTASLCGIFGSLFMLCRHRDIPVGSALGIASIFGFAFAAKGI